MAMFQPRLKMLHSEKGYLLMHRMGLIDLAQKGNFHWHLAFAGPLFQTVPWRLLFHTAILMLLKQELLRSWSCQRSSSTSLRLSVRVEIIQTVLQGVFLPTVGHTSLGNGRLKCIRERKQGDNRKRTPRYLRRTAACVHIADSTICATRLYWDESKPCVTFWEGIQRNVKGTSQVSLFERRWAVAILWMSSQEKR